MAVGDRLYTTDDLEKMPDDGKIYELHNGVLIDVPGSKYVQTVLAVWIAHLLISFLEEHNIGGQVTGADGTYVLDRYNTRIPDVAYISPESVLRQQKDAYLKGAPDLAVEVVSDSNTPAELKQRVGAYLAAGARLVWLIYPETRTIAVYEPDQNTRTLGITETLDGGDVLPGLNLPVSKIFERVK
jgi:Uma2 family endonuclease